MAVTIKDVARLAGVSPSSVCRALAGPDQVRPETRDRVRRAVDELGYSPNPTARALITGRTTNFGLVVPDIANPYFPGLIKAVQTRARQAQYSVFLADTDEDPALEVELIRALSKQVDGFVLCSPRAGDADLRGLGRQTPTVLVNRRVGALPSVTSDNVDATRQAIAHLAALGHRSAGYVAGPGTSWMNRQRLRGLRAAAATAGIRLVELGSVAPTFEGGMAAADPLLRTPATSVVAFNDLLALGLMSRMRARGVRVPGDFSVIGFDDIPFSGVVDPPVTTVAQDRQQIGHAAVDLLLTLLQDPEQVGPLRRVLPTRLIVRGSTGPAPRHRRSRDDTRGREEQQ